MAIEFLKIVLGSVMIVVFWSFVFPQNSGKS